MVIKLRRTSALRPPPFFWNGQANHRQAFPSSGCDAMARLGVTQARLAQHVELTVTRVTTHSGQPGSLAPARVTRSSPPFITLHSPPRSPQPKSLAAARPHPPRPAAGRHGNHSPRPAAVTRSSPPQSTRPSHSQRPVSLRWRSCQPLLATASLTDSVTCRCSCAKAEVYVVVRIWNTLIAIF